VIIRHLGASLVELPVKQHWLSDIQVAIDKVRGVMKGGAVIVKR